MINPIEPIPEQTPQSEEKSPGFKERLKFLAQPKHSEKKSQPILDDVAQEISYEQEEVIRDMTKAIQQDKKSLLQIKTMHAY